jgi:aryl carrier-like protein
VQRVEEVEERVPVGRPLANNTVRLLDRRLGQVPPGMPGEVWLGGAGVAAGYWRQPGLTAERFLPDPFAGTPGARMYRTGDLARWRPRQDQDATLDFLGRADQQVKVRGHRIELGEVEAALRQHSDVREAVVTVREDTAGDRRLVGYVVAADGAVEPLLRRWLADRLPEPWLPSSFVLMEALPLTGSGKVDRRALPAPGAGRPSLEIAYVAPSTSTEQAVADVWGEVLGREKVGVHDNFFEVGGSSLLLVRIHARLREVLGREVTMVQLFRHPTVQALARFLETEERESRALLDAEDRAQRRTGAVQQSATVDRQRQFLEEQRRRKEAGRRRR